MAIFIGSDLQTGNWGEDFLIEKLMEYLDSFFVEENTETEIIDEEREIR